MAERRRPARRRSPGRWLAPVALATVAVAAYAVVRSGASDDPKDGKATTTQRSTRTQATTATTRTEAAKPRTYTVKAGDTLSAIAAETGVPLATIQRLNPGLDARTLQTGQTLKLTS